MAGLMDAGAPILDENAANLLQMVQREMVDQ